MFIILKWRMIYACLVPDQLRYSSRVILVAPWKLHILMHASFKYTPSELNIKIVLLQLLMSNDDLIGVQAFSQLGINSLRFQSTVKLVRCSILLFPSNKK